MVAHADYANHTFIIWDLLNNIFGGVRVCMWEVTATPEL